LDSKRISIADMEFFLRWRVKVVQFKAARSIKDFRHFESDLETTSSLDAILNKCDFQGE